MTRTYCDICNRETKTATEYIRPRRVPRYVTDKDGNKIMLFGETVEPVKKELCPKCSRLLNVFVEGYLATWSIEDDKYGIQLNLVNRREW